MSNCPLCTTTEGIFYSKDRLRSYLQCSKCSLIYVPRAQLISEKDEEQRYQAHQNHETDSGYRRYLEQVAQAIVPQLRPMDQGLDFGCGSSTLLAQLLKARGHETESYDLYFHPDRTGLNRHYDFILLIEVIEHLRDPMQEMREIRKLLGPKGKLFIKTKFSPVTSLEFDNWFYKRDSTHVQFFSEASMNSLADQLDLGHFEKVGEDLVMLKSSR